MEEETTTRSPRSKIPLYIGCGFLFVSVVLLGAGGPMFFTERQKEKFYVEDQCLVQSSSYKFEEKCDVGPYKSQIVKRCYRALWILRYGHNQTRVGEIYGRGEKLSLTAMEESEKYSTGKTYPCWYNKEKPSEVIWFKPSSYVSLILLIISAVTLIIAIVILTFACIQLRPRADL